MPALLAAAAVSVLVPLAFLYLVRRLDLYASSDPRAVVLCLAWGMAAIVPAFLLNSLAAGVIGLATVVVLVAPVVEELAKSVVLVDQVRRPSFTYFVDGAILGFAAGIGFAIAENLLYLSRAAVGDGLGVSVNRVLSTTLMHATACALVGVALGRYRFGHGATRAVSLGVGLVAAMSLHLAFNNWVERNPDPVVALAGAIVLGAGGLALVGLLIAQGLREEREWLRQTLGLDAGVSPAEARAVDALRQLDTLLAPVGAHFGPARQAEVAQLLRLQARYGLKRQAATRAAEPQLASQLWAEAEDLRRDMDARRRAVGLYCMAYVRAVWPGLGEAWWDQLAEAAQAEAGMDAGVWLAADERCEPLVIRSRRRPRAGVEDRPAGRIVAIHSFRGGTGKTNITANLAALAVLAGQRVAIVDTDVQSPGIHALFGRRPESAGHTLNDYLWGECSVEAAAHLVAEAAVGPGLYLVPATLSTAAIQRVLRDGINVRRLHEGFRRLMDVLALDALFIDTHPGLNSETLLSVAVSDALLVVLRPDQQDYLGTHVTVEVARALEVPELALLVNKVPMGVDIPALFQEVQQAYDCPVLAVLPHTETLMRLSSRELVAVRYPDHPVSRALAELVAELLRLPVAGRNS